MLAAFSAKNSYKRPAPSFPKGTLIENAEGRDPGVSPALALLPLRII
jgi:hypothetical protein